MRYFIPASSSIALDTLGVTPNDLDVKILWEEIEVVMKLYSPREATKKAERIAAEGLTEAESVDNSAVILEVNSETDFVAKNEEFKNFVAKLSKTLIDKDVKTIEEANELTLADSNETIKEAI